MTSSRRCVSFSVPIDRPLEIGSDLVTPGLTSALVTAILFWVMSQPGGDTLALRAVLDHRESSEADAVASRLRRAGVSISELEQVLRDCGDGLFTASESGDLDWTQPFGGDLAVALLAAEVSALAAHLNSRAALVRARAVDRLLDEFSAVSVANELDVSRQKVYDIARASHRDGSHVTRVPWRR